MDRSRMFKNLSKDADCMRRRRNDQSIELRKLKKEQNLNKKRNINIANDVENVDPKATKNVSYADLVKRMQSSDPEEKFTATQQSRQALSQPNAPPIDEFVKLGAVKVLIKNLSDSQPVLFETAWALTNIASGSSENTLEVVKHGAVPKLIELLSHDNEAVVDQCVWALGNIAGDCAELRNYVIEQKVIPPTIAFLKKTYKNVSVVKNVAWMLSNLLRHKKPSPAKKVLLELLPVFKDLLKYRESQDVVADSAWAISYASDSSHNFADCLIESGILKEITPLLYSKEPKFIHPSLRIFGNLVIGEDQQTQLVIEYNFLPALKDLLCNQNRVNMIKEVCWLLSNIAAGTIEQKQLLIELDFIRPVFHLMEKGEFKVRKEACWCISNFIYSASKSQVMYTIEHGAIRAISSALTLNDTKMVELAIDTLQAIFEFAIQNGIKDQIIDQFEECQGQDQMEKLQSHADVGVYQKVVKFLENFLDYEDVNATEDEQIAAESGGTIPQFAPAGDNLKFSVPTENKDYDF